MLKKTIYALVFILLLSTSSFARPIRANIRSPYVKKFLVLKKLCRLSTKKDKLVEKVAYQQMIKVIFRDNLELYAPKQYNLNKNLNSIASYLNRQVERILTGIKTFNGCARVANLQQKEDRHLLKVLARLISNEIGQTATSSNIMKAFAKIGSDITSSIDAIEKNNPKYREHNLSVINQLKEALDMTKYIYQEQIRWLTTALFQTESIVEKIKPNNFSLIEVNPPPKVYIPNFSGKKWVLY